MPAQQWWCQAGALLMNQLVDSSCRSCTGGLKTAECVYVHKWHLPVRTLYQTASCPEDFIRQQAAVSSSHLILLTSGLMESITSSEASDLLCAVRSRLRAPPSCLKHCTDHLASAALISHRRISFSQAKSILKLADFTMGNQSSR